MTASEHRLLYVFFLSALDSFRITVQHMPRLSSFCQPHCLFSPDFGLPLCARWWARCHLAINASATHLENHPLTSGAIDYASKSSQQTVTLDLSNSAARANSASN